MQPPLHDGRGLYVSGCLDILGRPLSVASSAHDALLRFCEFLVGLFWLAEKISGGKRDPFSIRLEEDDDVGGYGEVGISPVPPAE